jgi:hypothetical protein
MSMRPIFFCALAVLALNLAPAPVHADAASSDDDTLSLSPVKKGYVSPTPEPTDTASPMPSPTEEPEDTEEPTAVPTLAPTAAATPTAVPTPRPMRPKPVPHGYALTGIDAAQTNEGVRIILKAAGPITGAAANLSAYKSAPERVLIKLNGASLVGCKLAKVKPVDLGPVKRVRLAQKSPDELWAVVDLGSRLAFRTGQPSRDSFEILLIPKQVAAAPSPVPTPRSLAEIPRINLMLFDLNVIYQDKQYDRFPCANFIYNVGDQFPLKRDFTSTLVFHHGYGAFVGNARILDPQGQMLAQTEQPFAFNLFNALAEFNVDLPWKVEFKDKGTYRFIVDLNGSDVLTQTFYVGQSTDIPPAP